MVEAHPVSAVMKSPVKVFGALRRTTGVAGDVHHTAKCLRQRVIGRDERVSTRAFDMDDLRAELGQLCADIRLRDKHPRANRTNAFERPESGNH
jgi:hypothetical protein